jgi:hypothetical protein
MSHLIPAQGDAFIYDKCPVPADTSPTTLFDNDYVRFVPALSTNHKNSQTTVIVPDPVLDRELAQVRRIAKKMPDELLRVGKKEAAVWLARQERRLIEQFRMRSWRSMARINK